MKTRSCREAVFALLVAVALVTSACGTLQIDTETATSINDPIETRQGEQTTPVDDKGETAESVSEVSVQTNSVPQESVGYSDNETGISFTNPEYGFTLHYPPTWTAEEVNDVDFVGPGSRSLQLSQGTVKLVIGYRRAGEEVALSGSGAPAGEFEVRGSTQMLGQDVERYVIFYEGKDKVVMYGEPGSGPLAFGGLEFSARMDDFNPDYGSVELSQITQDEADMILSSLAITESEGVSDSGAGDAYPGWQPYSNEQFGYSLMVPAAAEVTSLDPNERVAFIGPEIDGKPQFQFMLVHYDIDETEAASFMQDIAEGHRAFLESIGETTVGQVEELVVAGEPAIKIRFPAINESDPRDDYFFVHDGKMFTISITHFGGVEDEALNGRFLQSFAFE